MDFDIYREIDRQYSIKREKTENEIRMKKRRLEENLPKYYELEQKKNEVAIEYTKELLTKNGIDKEIAEENMRIKVKKIQEEIDKVLMEAGYNKNYLEPEYECSICKDTGRIITSSGEKYCKCFIQKVIDRTYKQYNMLKLNEENFNTFDIGYYSDKVSKEKYKSEVSPRDNINKIKKIAEKFCNNIDNKDQKNLLFVGNTGTGKTFLSNCIAYELINKGYTVIYQTAPILMDMAMEAKYNFDRKSENRIKYENIFNVDLLIIDDLGTETLNNNRFTELFNIINTRLLKNKKTIISTNLMLNELSQEYDERVMSRLIGNYIICKFIGDDIRFKKKKITD